MCVCAHSLSSPWFQCVDDAALTGPRCFYEVTATIALARRVAVAGV